MVDCERSPPRAPERALQDVGAAPASGSLRAAAVQSTGDRVPDPPVAPVSQCRFRPADACSRAEYCQRGREAMQVGAPADGPISPAAKNPATGAPANACFGGERVVVGLAEHPAPASVAGEHQRACGSAAPNRSAARAPVRRSCRAEGVAHVQSARLAGLDICADRDGPGSGRRRAARARGSPRARTRLAGIDDEAEQQPLRHCSRSLSAARPPHRAAPSALGGQRARDHVPLSGRVVISGPTGAAPATRRVDIDAFDATPTAPSA